MWTAILFASDLLALLLAALIASVVVHASFADLFSIAPHLQMVLFGVILWIALFERMGLYRRTFAANGRDEIYASLAACVMAMAPSAALVLAVPSFVPFRQLVLVTLLLTAVGVSLSRFGVHAVLSRIFPRTSRRIGVVGAPDRVDAVPGDLSLTAADVVVKFAIDDFDRDLASVVAHGDAAQIDWLQSAIARECTELIITEAIPSELMPGLLRITEARGIVLAFAPMRIRPHACDFTVRRDGGLALLYPQSLAIATPGADLMRRMFDLALVVPALVLLAPLLATVALLVYFDSGSPVFYRQIRVGRLGREFNVYKFRTMRVDAEANSGPVWNSRGEDRTTRIGKFLRRFSIDELPQLFNVLRGDMSVVGPRPERPFYVEKFRRMLRRYDERQLVRPGITGWAQINMRRVLEPTEIGEKLSYDLFYLEHWSIFMDVMIVCKTAFEFLFHSAA
ncbi:MAG: exopolysaccharide biosynthesis polyprenyl glycosylphosphotransferase [Candidatus Eremiobacteraeota bacterium]|nr:exopolysaccharide biosynthesis polyprenyl glycosylphosphotransferase [Candidatus Eremiobacteraeota bacterium]